ncbi:hypothetical protein [Acrocarpospora sp. B8E8]|uniref:Rv1733c family protein n=1 Tax=Acrocarpospora sp. B8E8 TaxID=3153572 RepID=UPI00325E2020
MRADPAVPRWVRYALCATVLAAFVVGQSTYSSVNEQAKRETAERVSVEAELIEAIPVTASGGKVYLTPWRSFQARWTTPDRVEHSGPVTAPISAKVGTVIEVWVDRESGTIADAPATSQDAATRAGWTVLLTILGAAALIVVARRLTLTRSSRGQAHTLEAEWRRIAAEWRRRYL